VKKTRLKEAKVLTNGKQQGGYITPRRFARMTKAVPKAQNFLGKPQSFLKEKIFVTPNVKERKQEVFR